MVSHWRVVSKEEKWQFHLFLVPVFEHIWSFLADTTPSPDRCQDWPLRQPPPGCASCLFSMPRKLSRKSPLWALGLGQLCIGLSNSCFIQCSPWRLGKIRGPIAAKIQSQHTFLEAQKKKLTDDCLNFKFFNYKFIFKFWPLLQLTFNRITERVAI